ncbi:unnamed protein product [Danaus chrysippus]|uniref:(African queen) hypothetical protein n=1 Tax=Danaus chrysippus TaxID=151541 RepID=A0A8J2Q9V8_9NEOP|nr:unnamed protein product [Danaus chrysippus]
MLKSPNFIRISCTDGVRKRGMSGRCVEGENAAHKRRARGTRHAGSGPIRGAVVGRRCRYACGRALAGRGGCDAARG